MMHTRWRTFFACLISFLFIQLSEAGLEPSTIEAYKKISISGINAVYRIATMNGEIYVGGQPTQASLAQLKKWQVKTIVDLRQKNEMKFDEAAAAKKLGINYVNIPADASVITKDSITEFNKTVGELSAYPIFVHCTSGQRAAMFMVINDVMENKTPVDAAIEDAKNFGLSGDNNIELIKETVKKYNLGS